MQNIAVVFDTNVYRDICDPGETPDRKEEMRQLMSAERAHQITSFASPYAIHELSSHVADQRDPKYSQCFLALNSLYEHCAENGAERLRVLGFAESQVSARLYNTKDADEQAELEAFCRIVRYLHDTQGIPPFAGDVQEWLDRNLRHVEGTEAQFVQDVRTFVVQTLNPACTGWDPLKDDGAKRAKTVQLLQAGTLNRCSAEMLVRKAWSIAYGNAALHAQQLSQDAGVVLTEFGGAVGLYGEIVKRIVETGCNLENKKRCRANWIWDIQVLTGAGLELAVAGMPLLLHVVTTDQDMLNAAQHAGIAPRVLSYADYRAQLGMK
jgi:hypothetical protein